MGLGVSWPVGIALLVFVAVSVVVGAALSGAGGWRSLVSRYPARPGLAPGERYRFSSLRTSGGLIGTASYGGCVTVGVGEEGISFELWAPFSLFHPPFHLPWAAVEHLRVVEMPGGTVTHFEIRGGGTLTVAGRAGAAIARMAEDRAIELSRG